MNIDWRQASTQRGLIWASTAVIGLILIALDKDPTQLLVLASGIAGGLGVLLKD